MDTLRVTDATYRLLRSHRRPGSAWKSTSSYQLPSGDWLIPIPPDIAYALSRIRAPNESDNDLIERIILFYDARYAS